VHFHDLGEPSEARDWCDITDEIVVELFEERRVCRVYKLAIRSVYPSAGERTTASVPMLLLPPGRFSMMNCWPSRSDSRCPKPHAERARG
jgi:hypothetical protein